MLSRTETKDENDLYIYTQYNKVMKLNGQQMKWENIATGVFYIKPNAFLQYCTYNHRLYVFAELIGVFNIKTAETDILNG